MNKSIKKMQNLIKKGRLDDPNVLYGDYETFEEIPLFSRWSYIDFLQNYSFDEKNKILLKQATALTEEAFTNARKIKNLDFNEYFICITITDWDYIDELGCISPNVFISKRKNWILPLLKLSEFDSPEANMIKTYLHDLNIDGKMVCVSKSYDNDNDRIYLVDNFFLT